MIYHRFGSPVKEIHRFNEESGEVVVTYEDDKPGSYPTTTHISELKADGGIHEILKAAVNTKGQTNGSSG